MEEFKEKKEASQEGENIGRKFSQFLKERNPELNEKFKTILPDVLEAIVDFIEKEFPGIPKDMIRGYVTGSGEESQPKMKYYDPEKEGYDIEKFDKI